MTNPNKPDLNTIRELSEHVDFAKMAEAMDINPNTLHKRIDRGSPELTISEQKGLKDYLLELYVRIGLIVQR